jgi:DNA-binding transcriptional MerR regulator
MFIKIGELARLTGKTVRAIHYYEELGIINPSQRSNGGFRLFRRADIHKINVISKLQELGLSLEEISEITRVWHGPSTIGVRRRLRQILKENIKRTERKIKILQALRNDITRYLNFLQRCLLCKNEAMRQRCQLCQLRARYARLSHFISAMV